MIILKLYFNIRNDHKLFQEPFLIVDFVLSFFLLEFVIQLTTNFSVFSHGISTETNNNVESNIQNPIVAR